MMRVEVYAGTTRVIDARGELDGAFVESFTSYYPGGVYGTIHVIVKRKVAEWWAVQGAQRLAARVGLEIAFEGWIDNLRNSLSQRGEWVDVTATGGWGTYMLRRRWDKPWADTRFNEGVWKYFTNRTYAVPDKCTAQREEGGIIRFTPKAMAWTSGEGVAVYYTAPTGQTIKRVTYSYTLAEGAQNWQLELSGSSLLWSTSTSGSGSVDHTLATPAQTVYLTFRANATQTPTADGTYYGQFSNIVVYTETGSINLTEIAKDVRGKLTDLNSTDLYIGSNTLSVVPFITDGWDRMADILAEAAGRGDSSFNAWACYLDHSERAPVPDGKPVLVVEQKPALTSADYLARVEDFDGEVTFDRDYGEIYNWIVVQYKDAATNARLYQSPDDDANLKDAASIAAYGQRDYVLDVETTSATEAKQAGRRLLAEAKEPAYRSTAPLRLRGLVRTAAGNQAPAALVRAGKRLKIENFLQDLSGSGLTMLITNTQYMGQDDSVAVSGGNGSALV